MKNLLFTLALLISFSSFGQTAEEYLDRGYAYGLVMTKTHHQQLQGTQ